MIKKLVILAIIVFVVHKYVWPKIVDAGYLPAGSANGRQGGKKSAGRSVANQT